MPIVFAGPEWKRTAASKLGFEVDVWVDDCPSMIEKQDLEKKFEELHKEFRAECKPFEDEFKAAEKKAKEALEKIAEKYGFKVYLGLESYVPNSRDKLDDELREKAEDYIGGLDYDYGQDPGEWWSPPPHAERKAVSG